MKKKTDDQKGLKVHPLGTYADSAEETEAPETTEETTMWHGVLCVENTLTGDGRILEEDSIRWDDGPLPLRYVASDVGGHDGAVVVGSILHIERGENGEIFGTGTLDHESEAGREAIRQVVNGQMTGVSVDLDDISFEVLVARDAMEKMNPEVEETTEDTEDTEDTVEGEETEDSSHVVATTFNPDDEVYVTTSARLRAATLVAIPAFAEAKIELIEDDAVDEDEAIREAAEADDAPTEEEAAVLAEEFNWVDDTGGLPHYIKKVAKALIREHGFTKGRAIATAVNTVKRWARGGGKVSAETRAKAAAAVAEWEAKKIRARASAGETSTLNAVDSEVYDHEGAVLASGGSDRPPMEWFGDPHLNEATPITVTEDGRVYGHLATWDSCHIAHPDYCTSPPSSQTGYAYFHTGAVLTREGEEVGVGHLTLNTTHANGKAGPVATLAHYENTGLAAADVRAGEDSYGIWVAGAVRSTVSEEDVRALRAAPLSGDWRRVQGNLELVAALAVNVPGFPVPRPKGLVASGEMQSLVASGMVPPKKVRRPGTPGALSSEDIRYLKALANRERRNQAREMKRKIQRAEADRMAAQLVARVEA